MATLKLMNNIQLTVSLNNAKSRPFFTYTGTPPGDSLSSKLFSIYLECAVRELREKLVRSTIDRGLPTLIGYAYDKS